MAKHVQITFDALKPHSLASWWASRLGCRLEDGHDVIATHPGHRWAVMQDPEGNEFCLH